MNSNELSYNRLKNEKSLYLKQHKDNPIHWWAYGPEALEMARKTDKPIFLSIGYSSCHWCHVMAHDSFSNKEISDYLNTNFINIKIDKEEFPDIDNYFQKSAQFFNCNGGWPLSAFTMPDLKPYYVGTFFPSVSNKNSVGFFELIKELKRAYSNEKMQVEANANQVFESIKNNNLNRDKIQFDGHFPHPNGILEAIKDFQDLENGGYGNAPKFPHFPFLEWSVEQMLEGMVTKENGEFIIKTSEKLLMGGINDHARGGIHRYSTDEKWLVPHFEKMLYDQAGYLRFLAKLSLIHPSPLVYDTIINTLNYLEDEMLSEDEESLNLKYFFSAQDADSEGVEGLFFTFSEAEFEDLINKYDDEKETLGSQIEILKKWFQISKNGNFENGLNVISLNSEFKQDFYLQDNWDLVRSTRRAIINERKNRIPPVTDNKGVASWNFMMTSALVDVIQYTQIDVIRKIATNLLNKVFEGIFKSFLISDSNGMKLRHSTTMEFSHPYLEDFVTFAESQLRLYEISSNPLFKQNFKDSIDFIFREFVVGDKMLTRAKLSQDFDIYPNQEYTYFDSSFKSPVGTFISLARRAAVLFSDRKYIDSISELKESATHTILRINPITSGEMLRGLIYPDEAYRVLKIPKSWVLEDNFLKLIPYFLPRFVFDYHEDIDVWEICTINSCELKGFGLTEFINTISPSNNHKGNE